MICPNCGNESQGTRCSNCGYTTSKSGGRVAAIVILIFLVIPSALFGACSAVIAIDASGGTSKAASGPVGTFAIMALAGIAVFLGSLYLVVKLWRS